MLLSPNYIIESRNLLKSKMADKMSKGIIDVLRKYDTTYAFILDAFECVLKLTHYNNALLKREALKSTVVACFDACFWYFRLLCVWSILFLGITHTTQCHNKFVELRE